ncbi:MAG: serine hydrolase domain-containing protein [Candidatus Thorarchaeota archaeon]
MKFKINSVIILLVLVLTAMVAPFFVKNNTSVLCVSNYWPTEGWLSSSPEEQGMDSQFLKDMENYIGNHSYNHDSIVIVKNGYIVFEKYFNHYDENQTHHLFSVTKSFVSALMGIALKKGLIDNINQRMLDFFDNYTIANLNSLKEQITIEHLLTMTSGFEWSSDFPRWFDMNDAPNQVQFVLDLPMDDGPGTHFNYNSGACQLLTAILKLVSNQTALEFAQEELFNPLGITNVSWGADKQGINYGGTLLYLSSRDMAKFGYLYLNNGLWDGQEIVPNDWVKNSTTSYIRSTIRGSDYGYLWWLDRDSEYYFAWGSEGQKIFVVPDYDMVVVFTATSNYDEPYEYLLSEFILPAISDYTPKATMNYSFLAGISIIILISKIITKKKNHTKNGLI